MPYKSDSQRRFFHAAEERGDIPEKTVNEFDKASKGKKLPEHVKKMAEGGEVDDQDGQISKYLIAQNQNDPFNGEASLSVPRGTIQASQPKTPASEALAPTDRGSAEESDDNETSNEERIQDSHPGHASETIAAATPVDPMASYVKGQEAQVDKYGPEQEKALFQQIMQQRGSGQNRLSRGLAGLGDAIMGVAGKTSPGFLKSQEDREANAERMASEVIPNLQKMNAEQMAQKQALQGQTQATPLGKAKADFLQPLLMKFFPRKSPQEYAKMLQNPDDTAKMIGIPTDVYKSEVEAKLKANELALQGQRNTIAEKQAETASLAEENRAANEAAQREAQRTGQGVTAAEALEKRTPFQRVADFFKPTAATQRLESVANPGGGVPAITSQAELDRLPPGAKYTFNGQPHTKRK